MRNIHISLPSGYKILCILITAVSVAMAVFSVINSGCFVLDPTVHHRDMEIGFENMLIEAELRHKEEIGALKAKLNLLRKRINVLHDETGELIPEVANQNSLKEKLTGQTLSEKQLVEDTAQVQAIKSVESSFKPHHTTEYHVEPYEKFNLQYIYTLRYNLGKTTVDTLFGTRRKEIMEVLQEGVNILKKSRDSHPHLIVTNSDFWEGLYRTLPKIGTQYILFFKIRNGSHDPYFAKIVIFRPFGSLLNTNKPELLHNLKEVIHIIVPIKNRLKTLKRFLANFVNVCVNTDSSVDLTFVVFGQNITEITNLITTVSKKHVTSAIVLVKAEGEFSRARAFEIGVKAVRQNDGILFLCDVDMIFNTDFLSRCRLNVSPGQTVYFPIVFSLYNPSLVKTIEGKVSLLNRSKLKVSDFKGFWRDFGFGMVCVWKSDFEAVGGFGHIISSGWGQEDLILFRKFIRNPNFDVIRSVDEGIFHTYHQKICDVNLTRQQYSDCIRSKAVNEASHAQLGQLAFKDEINLRKTRNLTFQRQNKFNL